MDQFNNQENGFNPTQIMADIPKISQSEPQNTPAPQSAPQPQQPYQAPQPQQQAYRPQPQYQQPPYMVNQPQQQPVVVRDVDRTREVMSVGSYIGTFILSSIPVVNLICWIVWLVSPSTNKNKKNFLIACIIIWLIGIVLSVIGVIIATTVLGVSLDELGREFGGGAYGYY